MPRLLTLAAMSKKITVLGATGHIGTALVHSLLQQGHHVTAVARHSARLGATVFRRYALWGLAL